MPPPRVDLAEPMLETAAAPAALASFDIFDTLIGRPYLEPADLHAAVWHALGVARVGPVADAPAWRRARVAAERSVRQRAAGREVTLEQIHRQLAADLDDPALSPERSAQLEIDQEGRVARPLAAGNQQLAAARRSGRRVAFLSDMYLPAGCVDAVLQRLSIRQPDDLLLVSSASGDTKDSGALFDQLLQRTGLPAAAVEHLGDNPHGDHAVPLKKGLRATLHPVPALTPREQQLAAAPAADPFIPRCLAGAARLARRQETALQGAAATIAAVSAAVAAPLLIGFVLWTLLEAQRAGIRRLYFLARDGQILQRLACSLGPAVAPDVQPRYLFASRQALYLPALDVDGPAALDVLRRIGEGRTLRAIEASLQLPEGAAAALLAPQRSGLAAGQRLSAPHAEALAAALLKSPHAAALRQQAQRERAPLRAYLLQEGLVGQGPVALVDIGWRGNLQALLARALQADGEPVDLLGLYFGLHRAPPPDAGESRRYVADAGRYNEALLELLCAADHGSTVRYELHGSGVRPCLASPRHEAALRWGLELQQRVVLNTCTAFVDAVPATLLARPATVDTLRELGTAAFGRFQRNPTAAEAEAYGAFDFSVDATHADSEEVAPVLSPLAAVRAFLPGNAQPGTLWAHGSLRRSLVQRGLAPLASALLSCRAGLGGLRWRKV